MKSKAGRFEIGPARTEKPACFGFKVADKVFILDFGEAIVRAGLTEGCDYLAKTRIIAGGIFQAERLVVVSEGRGEELATVRENDAQRGEHLSDIHFAKSVEIRR